MNINVQKNGNGLSVFAGNEMQVTGIAENQKARSEKQENGKTVFAGNLNMLTDRVEQKRQQARKLAMKKLTDVLADEKSIDDTVEEQKQRVAELKDEFLANHEELKNVKNAKEQYMAEYGLNEEGAKATPEQQAELLEYEKAENELNNRMIFATEEAKARNHAVEDIMVERLKSHPMVDAAEEADEIMEAAGKEIIGMLIGEAKDSVDEKLEEEKEKAEEVQEKKEEEEERLEKEETPEEAAASHTVEIMGELQDISQDHKMIQKKLKIMVDVNAMIEEDLKGILVDKQL